MSFAVWIVLHIYIRNWTQDEPYVPDFLPGDGVYYVHNSENKENDWEVLAYLFCCFQICVTW